MIQISNYDYKSYCKTLTDIINTATKYYDVLIFKSKNKTKTWKIIKKGNRIYLSQ